MKKSNFIALVLGTISIVFFGLGMCMAMLPEWNAFKPGVGLGCIGLILALITIITWRRMEQKEPIHITGKVVLTTIVAIIGSLGLVGIVVLLMLIPICKGLK